MDSPDRHTHAEVIGHRVLAQRSDSPQWDANDLTASQPRCLKETGRCALMIPLTERVRSVTGPKFIQRTVTVADGSGGTDPSTKNFFSLW